MSEGRDDANAAETCWAQRGESPRPISSTGVRMRLVADDRCDLLCLDLPRAEEIRRGLDVALAGRVAVMAKALGDPTRLTIAIALREGQELCVCDLGWITMKAENLVGHHLRVLREAGLARSRRDGKIVFYCLTETAQGLIDAHLAAIEALT